MLSRGFHAGSFNFFSTASSVTEFSGRGVGLDVVQDTVRRVGGNVLDFVAAMEQCSVRDAAIKLQMWFLVPAAGGSPKLAGKEPEPQAVLENKNGKMSKTGCKSIE